MIFAHAFIGTFIAKALYKKVGNLDESTQKLLIWGSAIIGSVAPDLDIVYLLVLSPESSHRQFLTHGIPLYIGVFLVGFMFFKILKFDPIFMQTIGAFILGAVIHILSDGIIDTIYPWLPLSKSSYAWQPFSLDKSLGFLGYMRSPYMILEITIIALGFSLLIKSLKIYKKELKILLVLLGIIQVGVAIGLIPFLSEFN